MNDSCTSNFRYSQPLRLQPRSTPTTFRLLLIDVLLRRWPIRIGERRRVLRVLHGPMSHQIPTQTKGRTYILITCGSGGRTLTICRCLRSRSRMRLSQNVTANQSSASAATPARVPPTIAPILFLCFGAAFESATTPGEGAADDAGGDDVGEVEELAVATEDVGSDAGELKRASDVVKVLPAETWVVRMMVVMPALERGGVAEGGGAEFGEFNGLDGVVLAADTGVEGPGGLAAEDTALIVAELSEKFAENMGSLL